MGRWFDLEKDALELARSTRRTAWLVVYDTDAIRGYYVGAALPQSILDGIRKARVTAVRLFEPIHLPGEA